MIQVHLAFGLVTAAVVVAAAVWGCVVVLRRRPSESFLVLARVAQGITALQIALGLFVLSGAGEQLPSGGHLLAALGVLAALGGSEALSRVAARRAVLSGGDGPQVRLEPAVSAATAIGIRVTLAESAVLAGGFIAMSLFASLAVITGWH